MHLSVFKLFVTCFQAPVERLLHVDVLYFFFFSLGRPHCLHSFEPLGAPSSPQACAIQVETCCFLWVQLSDWSLYTHVSPILGDTGASVA